MNSFFLDTSAIVKIYHKEVGTPEVEKLYENVKNKLYISHLTKLEYVSTLYKKYRLGEITLDAVDLAKDKFDKDCDDIFNEVKFASYLIEEAREIVESYGTEKGIRSLDALQLAFFNQINDGSCSFVCADKVLNKIAREIGIKVFSYPEILPGKLPEFP